MGSALRRSNREAARAGGLLVAADRHVAWLAREMSSETGEGCWRRVVMLRAQRSCGRAALAPWVLTGNNANAQAKWHPATKCSSSLDPITRASASAASRLDKARCVVVPAPKQGVPCRNTASAMLHMRNAQVACPPPLPCARPDGERLSRRSPSGRVVGFP